MAINVDVCPVDDEGQAYLLMVHHLQMAASYFEVSPEAIDGVAFSEAMGFSGGPALEWLRAMEEMYPEG